jgi:glycosyltransferase involved in cell wall biosynthesis
VTEPRITIVHDYLIQRGGAERVVDAMLEIYPGAQLATSVISDEYIQHHCNRDVRTTYLQHVPGATAAFRAMLPLYPSAFRRMQLPESDLVLVSSSGFAHHVVPPEGTPMLVYCHTPPRFLWRSADYFGDRRSLKTMADPLLGHLRRLDLEAASKPDQYMSNSRTTEERIGRIYDREAPVVYPPVNVDRFRHDRQRGDFLLVVSRLLGYKRIDLAVSAATRLGRRLVVIGDGPAAARLREDAGPTVEFMGEQGDGVVTEMMETCAAFIFPGEEDFGISPVEAMAAGAPVVAFNRAGATETVVDGETGALFAEQTVDEVAAAIERVLAGEWPVARLRSRAEEFRPERFAAGVRAHVDALLGGARAEVTATPKEAR